MSKCTYCKEDAGKGYDVCMNCKHLKNEVTLGNKPIEFYMRKILELGKDHDQIVIKTLARDVDKYNYQLKPLFDYWGLEEIRRKWKKERGRGQKLNSLHITMEKIPSLKGIRTDKR